jgi:hypothetical protein
MGPVTSRSADQPRRDFGLDTGHDRASPRRVWRALRWVSTLKTLQKLGNSRPGWVNLGFSRGVPRELRNLKPVLEIEPALGVTGGVQWGCSQCISCT